VDHTNKKYTGKPPTRRSLGQNFLVHKHTVRTIIEVSGVKPGDRVVELGVGLGALTAELAGTAAGIIGIEIDERLLAWLAKEGRMPENVELRQGDMLDISFGELSKELDEALKIFGNLPYNISSQMVFKLIDERDSIEWAVLMFQKEVAQRLMASPGSKDYGVLAVITGYAARITKLLDVPATLFRPKPKVASTLVRFSFRPPVTAAEDFTVFKETVRTAFQQRRKKMSNSLKGFCGLPRDSLLEALTRCGIDPGDRPEVVSIENFVCLSNSILKSRKSS